MLHNQKIGSSFDSSIMEQGPENRGPSPLEFGLRVLRRSYWIIIATTVVSFAASVGYLKVATPTYTAQAKVLMGGSKAPSVQPTPIQDEPPPTDLDAQIEILKSKAVATSVINRLNMANDPDINGKGSRLRAAVRAVREMLGIAQPDAGIDRQRRHQRSRQRRPRRIPEQQLGYDTDEYRQHETDRGGLGCGCKSPGPFVEERGEHLEPCSDLGFIDHALQHKAKSGIRHRYFRMAFAAGKPEAADRSSDWKHPWNFWRVLICIGDP